MSYQFLLYDHKDGIVTLTLNRPDRLNALGDTLREELYEAMSRASDDPEARVIVLTGAGRGFCSGGDMKAAHEVQEGRMERALLDRVAPIRDQVVLAMRDSPKPIIAAARSSAGAGMNLALACDMRLASTAARFGQTFVKRGLQWIGVDLFPPRLVGMAKACELIFTGDDQRRSRISSRTLLSGLQACSRRHTSWHVKWPMGHQSLYAWPGVPCTTTRTWICALPWNLKPSRKTSAGKRRTPGKASGLLSKSAPRASRGVKLLSRYLTVDDAQEPWLLALGDFATEIGQRCRKRGSIRDTGVSTKARSHSKQSL
jgi:hypothetical protein